ncbi:hypothetical protein R1flu_001413 [Riccia fluitans]|uniref:No apical meristem-associated C-terminal domain-containing protein n=1 Tax=Riccia fluitans TaxID=41844 RepID=A0ABD1Y375_9MARC
MPAKWKLYIGDLDKSTEKSLKRNKRVENNVPKSCAPSIDNAQDSPLPPSLPAYSIQQQVQQHCEEPKGNLKAKRKGKAKLDENMIRQEKAFWDAVKAIRKESVKESTEKKE